MQYKLNIKHMKKIYLLIVGVWLLSITSIAQKLIIGEVPNLMLFDTDTLTTVGFNKLEQSPETDIKKALYNKIAGLNVSQGRGRSSDNYATISFHGHAPLILVDGFPRDLNSVTMSEIESVTLLKDAATLALYGVRGANGVVNIITKRGTDSDMKISASYQFGLNTQFRSPDFANSYTYASSVNNALKLDGLEAKYSNKELYAFASGQYPYAYPNVNWQKEVYKDFGTNHQINATFDGGSDKFRYYVAAVYSHDKAMYKHTDDDPRYSTTPFDVRLNLRTNIDANITKTTLMQVGLMARMQEVNGSRDTTNSVYHTPSAAFPVKTEAGIFGGNNVYGVNNPVALAGSSGHNKYIYNTLYADLRIRQDLSELLEGLYADVALSFDNQGGLKEESKKTYRYSDLQSSILDDGTVKIDPIIYGKDSEIINHKDHFRSLHMRTNLKAKVGYSQTFNDHQVGGSVIFDLQSDQNNGRNNTFERQSLIANAQYSYLNRYFVNAVVSYSGTNVLPDKHQFNTYPAISASWLISNEDFMNFSVINVLKLRASYGLSGWDGNTSHELFRQSYQYASSYIFGLASNASGWSEGSLPVENLMIEKSKRATVGIDMKMFNNRFDLSMEGFYERRSNRLVDVSNSVSGVIGVDVAQLNAGINQYKGIDISVGWKDEIGDFTYGASGIFSFLRTKIIENKEPFQQYKYGYNKGNRLGQSYGLEAIGFFNDQIDINNSAVQTFGSVRPGDVKYKDQNGDNKIDNDDVVKMFQTSSPEIYYGFNLNVSYKNISLSADFQGVARHTISLLESPLYDPLIGNSTISNTFLNGETTWSEKNNMDATMPRLTTTSNENNYRNSSLWYRDGSFLKLRNLQLVYNLPKSTMKFADLSLYLRGTNLFSIDKIDFADPEQLGASYPVVRSYWAGVKFNF